MNTTQISELIERALNEACFGGDEHPVEAVTSRYFAPDYLQTTDGEELDRDGFADHMQSLRRHIVSGHIEVLEVVSDGTHFADRHLITATKTDGSTLVGEVYMFGDLTADGQFRRITETARVIDGTSADRELARIRD